MLKDGLRPASTSRGYLSGLRQWTRFHQLHDTPFWLIPPYVNSTLDAEWILILFVLWLHRTLMASTCSGYVTAVRDAHVRKHGQWPLAKGTYFRLPLFLKELGRRDAIAKRGRSPMIKHKVTVEMLKMIAEGVDRDSYWEMLIFYMMLVGFFGLLRLGEYTIRNRAKGFDPLRDLVWDRAEFFPEEANTDRFEEPQYAYLDLGLCKGDQKKRQFIYLYRQADAAICPVRALHALRHAPLFAGVSKAGSAPIFALSKGPAIYRETFTKGMRTALGKHCGRKYEVYGTHSLRRGGAQALCDNGAPPWIVQLLGRWSSDAYKVYCDANLALVLGWSRLMGRPCSVPLFVPRRN